MKRKWLWVILTVAVASTMPVAYRTAILASDVFGLLVIASMTDDEFTMHPYSKNGVFVSPDRAVWILRNFNYPYQHCSRIAQAIGQCDKSPIEAVGTILDHPDAEVRARLYKLLDHFIQRGEPVNVKDANGVPLVQQAIFFANERYLKALMDAGADLSMKQGTDPDAFDAREFARFLAARKPEKYDPIVLLLEGERVERE